MGSGVTRIWRNVLIPLRLLKSIERVCISIIEGANLFTLCERSLTMILGDLVLGDEKCVGNC